MTTTRTSQHLDLIFQSLSSKHRREIIYLLGLQPYSISQLASMRRLSLPAIYKHIKALERAKLIHRKKTGQTTYLTLNRTSLLAVQKWLTQFYPYWGSNKESLANYKRYLKGGEKT